MKKALEGVAQEISHSLLVEMRGHQGLEGSTSASIVDLLLQQLAREIVQQLEKADVSKGSSNHDLEARLQKVENGLEKLVVGVAGEVEKEDGDEDEDEDEVAGAGSSFPNLKYAKPKYKNVESILKYMESDEDKGGVKLVIMNFND